MRNARCVMHIHMNSACACGNPVHATLVVRLCRRCGLAPLLMPTFTPARVHVARYEPEGLLPGARDFYSWLVSSGTPHVFLSNTGAKNSMAVQHKFATTPFVLADEKVPLANILTACEAQVMHAKPPMAMHMHTLAHLSS